MEFLEKRRQKLFQMFEVDIQDAELTFTCFKVRINSDPHDEVKLYP